MDNPVWTITFSLSLSEFLLRGGYILLASVIYAGILSTPAGQEFSSDHDTAWAATTIGVLYVLLIALAGSWLLWLALLGYFAISALPIIVRAIVLHFQNKRTKSVEGAYYAGQEPTQAAAQLRR